MASACLLYQIVDLASSKVFAISPRGKFLPNDGNTWSQIQIFYFLEM